jgi:hypothetical protein
LTTKVHGAPNRGEIQDLIVKQDLETQTQFTILSVHGDEFGIIDDRQQIPSVESESRFLLWGLTLSDNITFTVNVFSSYKEYRDENDTLRRNTTLFDSFEVDIEQNMFQRYIDIDDLSSWHWIEIKLNKATFLFKFRTSWNFLSTTQSNVEWLMQNTVYIAVAIVVSIIAVFAGLNVLERVYAFPPIKEKELVPIIWFLVNLITILAGWIQRPPNFVVLGIGIFMMVFQVTCYLRSDISDLKQIEFDDTPNKRNLVCYIHQEAGTWNYINLMSYTDLLFRLLGKNREIDIENYLIQQEGSIDYKCYVNDVELPQYNFKLDDNIYSKIAAFIISAVAIVGFGFAMDAGLTILAYVCLLVIPAVLVVYVLLFNKITKSEFDAEYYSKTSVRYFRKSISERIDSDEQYMRKMHNKYLSYAKKLKELAESEYIDENKTLLSVLKHKIKILISFIPGVSRPVSQKKMKMRLLNKRIKKINDLIPSIRKTTNEMKETANSFAADSDFWKHEEYVENLKTLSEAGNKVEELKSENNDLQRQIDVGSAFYEDTELQEWNKLLSGRGLEMIKEKRKRYKEENKTETNES